MSFQLSSNSKKHREGIDPDLIRVSDRAIEITLVDFGHGPVSGKRSASVQNGLFLNGDSKADGYEIIGKHQPGEALDFYAYVDGKASWKPEHLCMVAAAFLQAASELGVSIEWGGLWNNENSKVINGIKYGWDMAHIQKVKK